MSDSYSAMGIAMLLLGTMGSPFVVMGIQVARPGGRRGRLGAERAHLYEGIDPARLRGMIQSRLDGDKFRILPAESPLVLDAERRAQRPPGSMMAPYPYQRLPLRIRVVLQAQPQGTLATFSVQSLAYIYRDTGEGEYLEAFLDFLMGKQVFRSIPPDLTPQVQMGATTAGWSLIFPWLAFLPGFTDAQVAEVVKVSILVAIIGALTGVFGMVQIALNPTRFRGYWLGAVAIVLGALGIVASIIAAIFG